MKIFLKILFILITIDSYGQFSQKPYYESLMDFPGIIYSENKVEIKLLFNFNSSTYNKFVWLRKDSSNLWTGNVQDFIAPKNIYNRVSKIEKISDITFEEDLDADLMGIMDSLRLRYPDQQKVLYDLEAKDLSSCWLAFDGTSYRLKITINNISKEFNLHSPSAYLKQFPESVELKFYCDLLKLIEKGIGINLGQI
jgi:hypothetical protein